MSRGCSIFAARQCGVYFQPESACTNPRASYTNSESSVWRAVSGTHSLYLKPKTLDEAITLLATPGGKILAGGTDFYPALGERLPQGLVVDITALREIRGISIDEEYVRM